MRACLPVFLVLLVAHPALGQTFDAHGPFPAADPGRPGSPVLVRSPFLPAKSTGHAGVLLEYADAPLVYVFDEDGVETREEALGGLFGANLAGTWGATDRVAISAVAPVWFTASGSAAAGGPTLGDVMLSVPVGLVLPDKRAEGWSMAAVPSVRLPTGNARRYLGDGAFGGALALAAGYRVRRLGGGVDVAFELDGASGDPLWPGGPTLQLGGWVGYGISDRLDGRVELRATQPLDVPVALPLEAMVTGRWKVNDRVSLSGGVGTAPVPGVGAAAIRGFAGVHLLFGPGVDEAIDLPEPPPPPVRLVRVAAVDPDGRAIRGAAVSIGDAVVAHTDADGIAVLSKRTKEGTPFRIERADLDGAGGVTLPAGEDIVQVQLDWLPVRFDIRVTDPRGKVVDADVSFEGGSQPLDPDVDDVGTLSYSLEPGDYTVTIAAEGMGTQQRSLSVLAGRRQDMRVDVVLFPVVNENTELKLTVVSPDGRAVEDAFVEVGGQLIGTTGSGGGLSVRGLADGDVELVVGSDAFAQGQSAKVKLTEQSPTEARIELGWLPGSVKVVARGPDGGVTDAMAQLTGPVQLPPALLGPDGERVFVLRPGLWTLVISSPALGLQERAFEVTDEANLLLVEVALLPDEGGDAQLALRVLDADGRRIEGAQVSLDGMSVGASSTAGTLRLSGLETGERQLVIEAANMRDYTASLDLVDGVQDRDALMSWLAGSVRLSARDPGGDPMDALVLLAGPGAVPPTQLGEDGEHLFQLESGLWELLVSSELIGMQARDVDVPDDHKRLIDVTMGLDRPEQSDGATLALTVTGPDERPLAGAEVRLEDRLLGTTGTEGTLRAGGLAPGPRSLVVDGLALGQRTVSVDLDTTVDTNEAAVALDWAEGALRVEVEGPSGPVTDALVGVANASGVQPPLLVEPDGSRMFELTPGEWSVLVSSGRMGIQERTVQIPPNPQLSTVRVKMRPMVGDSSVLLVRVRDEDRAPVAGAEVRIDEQSVGRTSPGGILLASGLGLGKAAVEVVGTNGLAGEVRDVKLAAGSAERTFELQWQRSIVSIQVVDADGKPVDATVAMEGPELLPERRVGPDGLEDFALRPGDWKVFASAPGLKVVSTELSVPPGDDPLALRVELSQTTGTERSGSEIRFEQRIEFALSKWDVPESSRGLLDDVAGVLLASPDIVRIEVQGHTDDTGDPRFNQLLSERRAASVMEQLVLRGVPREKLVANGYGLLRPLVGNDTVEGRATNRRVQFVILESR